MHIRPPLTPTKEENKFQKQILQITNRQSKMVDTHLELWEVFLQSKAGANYTHAGNVHASDNEMALQNARDLYTRRSEGSSIWVVPSKYIVASKPEDADMLFEPAADKIYRHPTFYEMPEGSKQI